MDTNITDEFDALLGNIPDRPVKIAKEATKEEKKAALKAAQDEGRGHPKAGTPRRPPLTQINVKCDRELRLLFEDLSLTTGRTKRDLLREALGVLRARYMK